MNVSKPDTEENLASVLVVRPGQLIALCPEPGQNCSQGIRMIQRTV